MTHHTRFILAIFALLAGSCADETASPPEDNSDVVEPEECEAPAMYYWPGCASSEDPPEIAGCFIRCEDPSECPEDVECQSCSGGLVCESRTINPCALLACQGCNEVIQVCVEP